MTQVWDPARYAATAAFVPALGRGVVELLAPQPGERILDLGCGDGALTTAIVEAGAVVVAVDASPDMVGAARARGLDARVADGAELDFDGEFDAVFSNAALHWMARDPDAVVAGVARALRPGGRFVAEMGGHGNVAAIGTALTAVLGSYGIDAAAVSPWFYPTTDDYAARLNAHGFDVRHIELFGRPTPLPGAMSEWLETFAQPFLGELRPDERAGAVDAVTRLLQPWLCDGAGRWTADYVRLRFAAVRR